MHLRAVCAVTFVSTCFISVAAAQEPDTTTPVTHATSNTTCSEHLLATHTAYDTCLKALVTTPASQEALPLFDLCPCDVATPTEPERMVCQWADLMSFVSYATALSNTCAAKAGTPDDFILFEDSVDPVCVPKPEAFMGCVNAMRTVAPIDSFVDVAPCECVRAAVLNISTANVDGGDNKCSTVVAAIRTAVADTVEISPQEILHARDCTNCTPSAYTTCYLQTVSVPIENEVYVLEVVYPASLTTSTRRSMLKAELSKIVELQMSQLYFYKYEETDKVNGERVFFKFVNVDPIVSLTIDAKLQTAINDETSTLRTEFQASSLGRQQLITGKEVVVQTEDNEEVPAWAIVLLILFGVAMIVLFGVLAVMCLKGDGGEADDVSTSESSEEMEDGVVKALPEDTQVAVPVAG